VLRLTAGNGLLSGSDEVTITVNPEPAGTPGVIASPDFVSGGSSGGTGWSNAWTFTGPVSVSRFGGPRELHPLRVRARGTAARSVDPAGLTQIKLRFFYKRHSLEAGEYGSVEVNDGSGWSEVFRHEDPDAGQPHAAVLVQQLGVPDVGRLDRQRGSGGVRRAAKWPAR
jgi:hypothetical protein